MGVYDLVLTGPRTADLGPSWNRREAFFGHFWGAQTKHQKSSKTIIKHMVFATWGSQMDEKWLPKVHLFLLIKSYESFVKHRFRGTSLQHKNSTFFRFLSFLQKTWFFKTERFVSTGAPFWGVNGLFLVLFWVIFWVIFWGLVFYSFLKICILICKLQYFVGLAPLKCILKNSICW